MLTEQERLEIEELKKDPFVKIATKSLQRQQDPDKKRLYQLRWLRKKGQKIVEDLEMEMEDTD